MIISSLSGKALASLSILFGIAAFSGGAAATPLPSAKFIADAAAGSAGSVQKVHRRWRGRGWGYYGFYGPRIYVGPRYYGYAPDYYYYPRYSYYPGYRTYRGGYYRPYRRYWRYYD